MTHIGGSWWQFTTDDDGAPYYYNEDTKVSCVCRWNQSEI